ncbi:ABC transporter substrate-binding protein [Alteromonadaceae bacterium M269]|nr:ABC transporter substrate-binding protein [Alteromonadaceae bacterium M269]
MNQRALFLLSFILLSSCSDIKHNELSKKGVIYCSEGDPATFNPQLDTSGTTADATSHQLYSRLIEFDPNTSKIAPGLASSWLVSRDGLTYTFQLRRNVAFHSTSYFTPTRSFNADDVIFSINRWRLDNHPYNKVSGGNYPYFVSLGLNEVVEDVSRINGYRVEIKLTRPDSSFLANLATDFSVILSEEYATQLLAQGTPSLIDTKPVGTGPYKFVDYRKDSFIRYQKHENYWQLGDIPEQLIYDITTTDSLRLAKLISGECDATSYISNSEIGAIEQRPNLVLNERPGLNIGFWAFNTQKEPFNDAKVRRALALAIDKNTLIEAIYLGSADRAHGLLPETSWAFEALQNDTNFNPALARQLLDEAGIPPGFSMDIWAMPVQRAYNPNATKMAEIIQSYLQDIQIDANIVTREWSTFREELKNGEHDSVLIGWSADNGDPDNFYRPLLSCQAIKSGTNRARWCSRRYDDLIQEALLISDIELRKTYYHLANAVLAEEMPLVPIAHAYRYQAHSDRLHGLKINPFGGIRFGDVEKR